MHKIIKTVYGGKKEKEKNIVLLSTEPRRKQFFFSKIHLKTMKTYFFKRQYLHMQEHDISKMQ